MKQNVLTAVCLTAFAAAAIASPLEAPPPYAGDVKPAPAAAEPAPRAQAPRPREGNPLLPSEQDRKKAREDREHGKIPPKFDKQTKIEAVRDQNNHVTEYVVTPGSTQIPYRIENQADRPIDSTPGGNSKSTLGTTKFIEIGW